METVNGSQVIYQVNYGTPGIYLTPFKIILEEDWSKYHDIFKTEEMSKRYYKKNKAMAAEMTEEQIKAVMELYKPNVIQKIFMKYFSTIETTRRPRQILTAVAIIAIGAGIVFNSLAEILVGVGIILPLTAGTVYNMITDKKRVSQLMSVLSMTEDQVKSLEVKYYLA